jgi:hypothetical protein
MESKPNKAYRIVTKANPNMWTVYSAPTSGKAKTSCFYRLREAYYAATYAWISSCRRAPQFDSLAEKYSGCIAWRDHTGENWEQDKGHWYDWEVSDGK